LTGDRNCGYIGAALCSDRYVFTLYRYSKTRISLMSIAFHPRRRLVVGAIIFPLAVVSLAAFYPRSASEEPEAPTLS
jgi:hypothetical protein